MQETEITQEDKKAYELIKKNIDTLGCDPYFFIGRFNSHRDEKGSINSLDRFYIIEGMIKEETLALLLGAVEKCIDNLFGHDEAIRKKAIKKIVKTLTTD